MVEKKIKYASQKYNISMSENEIEEIRSHQKRIKSNIGDNIQSIASERFLPVIDKRFNRFWRTFSDYFSITQSNITVIR